MSDILLVVFAVVFVLGVAINIHEFGHFAVARLLGMRVEAFSFFGIGPRIWGFKRGHTDYRISAIPLGAYVKLYGDEATAPLEGGESEGEKVPDEELYELRPRWQKFLVMLGGPFMNIVLALAIPFATALWFGVPSVPAPIVGSVVQGGAAQQAGLKPGDRIVEFDGIKDPTWTQVMENALLLPGMETPIVVEREGKRVRMAITPGEIVNNGNKLGDLQMEPDAGVQAVVIGRIQEGMPAAESDLAVGDRITSVNGQTVRNIEEMQRIVKDSKGEPISLVVNRNGETREVSTRAEKTEQGYLIGIAFESGTLEPVGFVGATTHAFNENWRILRLTGKAFGQMFAGERSVKEGGIAGPVGIVQIIATIVRDVGIGGLFYILMVISLNLGIFNLLPIPLLDGGQIAVLGIEAVLAMFGLTLSVAVKEKIQLAGLAIILLLMVVVLYFDISRLIG
ncbi:MAG: RIP metalloprotease RseP [Acidobacteriota bacterium]|nr:MAG: RIP metalloprotease RseP [Acidobacteriota bacterium]